MGWFERHGFNRLDRPKADLARERLFGDHSEWAAVIGCIAFVLVVAFAVSSVAKKGRGDGPAAGSVPTGDHVAFQGQKPSSISPQPAAPPESDDTAETVFRAVSPSVVVVRTSAGQVTGLGSGVVVGPGMVATNQHVVRGFSQVAVEQGGRRYAAQVVYEDPEYDLVALHVPGLSAPPVKMASFESLRSGQRVYAVGAPRGLELSISQGLVSGIRPSGRFPSIQTDAPISPGSSGGGLFDTAGRLVGITTSTYTGGQQINFALVADLIPLLPDRSAPVASKQAQAVGAMRDQAEQQWRNALGMAQEALQRKESDWRGCTAMANQLVGQLNEIQGRMNGFLAARRVVEYNSLVPSQNSLASQVRSQNAECAEKHRRYVAQVETYNNLVGQYNRR